MSLSIILRKFVSKGKQKGCEYSYMYSYFFIFIYIPIHNLRSRNLLHFFFQIKDKASRHSPQEMDKVRVGTADLLDVLTEKEPMTDFSFALGTDTFMDLSSWKWRRSKDIFRFLQGRFLVLYRKQRRHQQESPNNHNATEITEEEVLERIRKVNQEYNHHWHHERKEDSDTDADTDTDADAVGPTRLLRIPELSDVSSTQVRACTKVEDLEGLLVPEVLKYIVDNQLYGFSMQ